MTVQEDQTLDQPQTKRAWRERLAAPLLIAGGVLTLTWIMVLVGVAWRIVGAVAGTAD